MNLRFALLSASAVALIAPMTLASPVTTFNDTLDTEFFPGSGNSNEHFAITRFAEQGGNNIELGLKSKERFFGIGNVGINDNTYTVQPGFSPESGSDPTLSTNAWWNFDFSVDLGSRTLADTQVVLTIDFDNDASGPVVLDFGTDGSLGSLLQGSQNIAFGYLGFDPNAIGTYDFTLSVFDRGVPFPLASITMQTVVVPLPGAAGLALAGLGLLGVRRRR
jgi:hypothetical protein